MENTRGREEPTEEQKQQKQQKQQTQQKQKQQKGTLWPSASIHAEHGRPVVASPLLAFAATTCQFPPNESRSSRRDRMYMAPSANEASYPVGNICFLLPSIPFSFSMSSDPALLCAASWPNRALRSNEYLKKQQQQKKNRILFQQWCQNMLQNNIEPKTRKEKKNTRTSLQ